MATKGYVRKITKKQALSYRRLVPNGLGVTAIAAVNGRGAAKRAHRRVRRNDGAPVPVPPVPVKANARARYTQRGLRDEMKELRTRRQFTPAQLRRLRQGKRVEVGEQSFYSPYAQGYDRAHPGPTPNRRRKTRRNARAIQGMPVYQVREARWEPVVIRGGKKRRAPAKPKARRKPSRAEYARRYDATLRTLGEGRKAKRRSRRSIVGMPVMSLREEHEWEPLVVRGRRRRASSSKESSMKGKKKRRTAAQRAAFAKMQAGLKKYRRKGAKKKSRGAKRAATATRVGKKLRAGVRTKFARPKKRRGSKKARTPAQKAAFKKMIAGLRKYHGKGKKSRKSTGKKRRHYAANGKRKAAPKRRTTFGKFRRVSAKVGGRKVPTYLYRTKRGVKHIPLYALAGARSAAAFRAATSPGPKSETKSAARIRRRVAAIMRQRTRSADRIGREGGIFTPNRGRAIPYETWSESMYANKKRRKARKSRSAGKKVSRHTKRSAAARKAARTRQAKHAKRSAAAKKAARTRKRLYGGARKHRKHAKPNRRHHTRRHYAANRRRRRASAGTALVNRRHHATPNRRRHHRRHYSENRRRRYLPMHVGRVHYASNRRRHHRRRHYASNGRRGYTPNAFTAKDFFSRFLAVLKLGAIVTGGFFVHRVLSKALEKGLTSNAQVAGALGAYSGVVAQVLAGAAGLLGLDFVASATKQKLPNEFAIGVFTSLVHGVALQFTQMASPQAADFLSGYGDNPGRAYSGYGEYIATSGFGAPPMLSQAAAGFGAQPMISQAAAGYGEYIATSGFGAPPMISQAAAGFGAQPMISQAAAGMGEYIATGLSGIGEYEMTAGVGSFGVEDDGIRPDTMSAEMALNMAEQAAGIGLGDAPVQSQVIPTMLAKPITEAQEGARAGTFQGRDGIFG